MKSTTKGETFEAFVERTTVAAPGDNGPRPNIVRNVPEHPISYLDGCSDENIREAAEQIAGAIEKGAPIYTADDHESCFRIYEGTALRLENELPSACKGVREALGRGLLRAQTLDSYTEKAWAMRDAFDGLLAVIVQRIEN